MLVARQPISLVISTGQQPARTTSTLWSRHCGVYGGLEVGISDFFRENNNASVKCGPFHLKSPVFRALASRNPPSSSLIASSVRSLWESLVDLINVKTVQKREWHWENPYEQYVDIGSEFPVPLID